MSGEQLPQSTQRDLKRFEKRLFDAEMRLQALALRSLDEFDDTQILYRHPTSAPAAGDALLWDDSIDTEFGGAWVPGWPDVPSVTFVPDGSATSGATIDLIPHGSDPPPGLYVASIIAQASPPADCCGWVAEVSIDGPGAFTVRGSDQISAGLKTGVWTGSTGDSGTYGWQPAEPPDSFINASCLALVGIDESQTMSAYCSLQAWVLDDPGTGPTHFGAKDCTATTSLALSVSVFARRINTRLP